MLNSQAIITYQCWYWGGGVQEPLILADVICEQPLTASSIVIDDIGHHLIPMKGTESSPFPPRDQLMKSLLSSWLIGNSYSWLIGPNPTHSSHQPKLIWQLSAKNNKIKPILLNRRFLLVIMEGWDKDLFKVFFFSL